MTWFEYFIILIILGGIFGALMDVRKSLNRILSDISVLPQTKVINMLDRIWSQNSPQVGRVVNLRP